MPAKGSQSEQRAIKAKIHLLNEVLSLCLTIDEFGDDCECDYCDGKKSIKFRNLFNMYQHISNKVSGLLVRAKNQGFVSYDGEALFQGSHDNVVITLSKKARDIRREIKEKIIIAEAELEESFAYELKNGPIYS